MYFIWKNGILLPQLEQVSPLVPSLDYEVSFYF